MFILGRINLMCMLPKEVGRCRGSVTRFYFNYQTETCEQFTYGGCGGNANNFDTLDECQQACMIGKLFGRTS